MIAEKPSVAMSIAKVLGAKTRREGYMDGNGFLVTWCVGHLVALAPADAYDPRYSKWSCEDLPILPDPWQFQVLPDTKKQFNILRQLMGRDDVDTVVCATDAGREGELIFRLTYDLCKCAKPVKRLWISSMEESAIRRGFEHLSDGKKYEKLSAAALGRATAVGLIGINGTRLFTTLYKGKTLNVGRVVTPTLALLVERETAISNFKKEKFYTVELGFQPLQAASGRFASKTDAEKLRTACLGKTAVVRSVSTQDRSERPPKLYDLTTLQREANRLFGYTAQETLDYLQALYEKRLATYPRTDSRYLTGDMADNLPDLCSVVACTLPFMAGQPLLVNAAQVVDSSKVTDHHAIIPTREIASVDHAALPTGERNILHMIAARLLCAVGDFHTYAETAVTLECGGASFTAKGRTVTAEGWKAVERAFLSTLKQKPQPEDAAPALPMLEEGQRLEGLDAVVRSGVLSPPAHFTEDTLLSAMERASAEDFAKLEDVERKGLGTPATRAATIEKLVRSGFVQRQKKQLIPTEKGTALIAAMPDQLKSAKLTAEWEERLGAVERGELPPEDFMAGITAMLDNLVQSYRGANVSSAALSRPERTVVGRCPRCGKNVVEGKKSFYCEGYHDRPSCGFALWKNDRFFTSKHKELTKKVVASLLKDGRVELTGLFSERKEVYYDAAVVLDDDGGKYVRYKLEFDNKTAKKEEKRG